MSFFFLFPTLLRFRGVWIESESSSFSEEDDSEGATFSASSSILLDVISFYQMEMDPYYTYNIEFVEDGEIW